MLHLLNQKKSEIQKKMADLWKLKDDEKKSWTREQATEYETLEKDIKEVSKEIDQRIEYQRHIQNEKPEAEKKFEKETDNIGVGGLVKALIYKKYGDSAFKCDLGKVNEFTREAENQYGNSNTPVGSISIPPRAFKATLNEYKRDLMTTETSGGRGIQDYLETPTLDVLYAKTVLGKVGAKVKELSQGTGSYKVVKLVDSASDRSSTKAEGTALDTRNLMIAEEFELSPKRLGRIVVVSNLWLRQAKDPGVVERALLKEWASAFDAQALNGDGLTTNIKGILRTTGLLEAPQKTGLGANVGDTLSWEKLTQAVEKIEKANGSSMDLAWLINPETKRKSSNILKSATSGSKFIFEGNMLGGKRTAVSTLIPNNVSRGTKNNLSNLLLVAPSMVCIVHWSLPAISLSDTGKDWFEQDETAFRVQGYCNVGLERPDTSHCLVKQIDTA